MINIHPGYKILFTGDSITDCGSSLSEDINFLGHGYPIFIASLLGVQYPELELTLEEQIRSTARQLSEAMLYSKFLQNIPVAGVVGGVKDGVFLRRVQQYAAIKYRKRFLLRRKAAK